MPEESDQRFPKSARLRKQSEFDRVFHSQHFAADATLVARGCRNDDGKTKLGLSVSRKVGNAVVRNRWKRTIREAFRQQRGTFPQGLDLVIRPRKGAVCDYGKICDSLAKLVLRLEQGLVKAEKRGTGNQGSENRG